ncbi:MAG: hypothetical protein K2Q09_04590 [Phycisphaerales bacterium]|nr:hypothetical protein [Phycisphaerales bacterium]
MKLGEFLKGDCGCSGDGLHSGIISSGWETSGNQVRSDGKVDKGVEGGGGGPGSRKKGVVDFGKPFFLLQWKMEGVHVAEGIHDRRSAADLEIDCSFLKAETDRGRTF